MRLAPRALRSPRRRCSSQVRRRRSCRPRTSARRSRACPGAGGRHAAAPARGHAAPLRGHAAARPLLPPEVWRNREQFFHDGMRIEVGPATGATRAPSSYRRPPSVSRQARELDARGQPHGQRRGAALPARLDRPEGARRRAALGVERRAPLSRRGPSGKLPHRRHAAAAGSRPEGDWFLLQTRHRSDLAAATTRADVAPTSGSPAAASPSRPTRAASGVAADPLARGRAALRAARRHLRLRADDAEGAARGVAPGWTASTCPVTAFGRCGRRRDPIGGGTALG